MAEITARDITEAKRQAREEHIGDDGRAEADHIFVHVPEILGVDGWHRSERGERELNYEHCWHNDDETKAVFMVNDAFGWEVTFATRTDKERERFAFEAKKHAERRLVQYMLEE